ncbi:hypothetical protein M5689_016066 [Euphorbia peplus]|nr:hypothetical protein M5689_016066 [Euphorbia peplus]
MDWLTHNNILLLYIFSSIQKNKFSIPSFFSLVHRRCRILSFPAIKFQKLVVILSSELRQSLSCLDLNFPAFSRRALS